MNEIRKSVRTRLRSALYVCCATLAMAGCKRNLGMLGGSPLSETSVPPPPFSSIDSVSVDTALAYARSLTYADPSTGDALTITEGSRTGTIRFVPVLAGRLMSIGDLTNGRFIARWERQGDSVRYPMRHSAGFMWLDTTLTHGWRMRYYASNASGFADAGAFASEDVDLKDSYPLPKSPVDTDPSAVIRALNCVYTDRRWVCPGFTGLTQPRVDAAYARRP